ncbi:hypothetical protein SARC_12982, partial [Sphaeroforma arctica JP610]
AELMSALECIPLCHVLNTNLCQGPGRIFSDAKIEEGQWLANHNLKRRETKYPNYIPQLVQATPSHTDACTYTQPCLNTRICVETPHTNTPSSAKSGPAAALNEPSNPQSGVFAQSEAYHCNTPETSLSNSPLHTPRGGTRGIVQSCANLGSDTTAPADHGGVVEKQFASSMKPDQISRSKAAQEDDLEDWLDGVLSD